MPWAEFGMAGAIAGTLMATFIWWVRTARTDLRESQGRFISHLETTGQRQTEAIVASSVATGQSVHALRELAGVVNRHDERAQFRHDAVINAIHEATAAVHKDEEKLP